MISRKKKQYKAIFLTPMIYNYTDSPILAQHSLPIALKTENQKIFCCFERSAYRNGALPKIR